jgi:hypothetical protein
VLSYAVMSNHFHLVVSMQPDEARDWSNLEVATRWCTLYPRNNDKLQQARINAIATDPIRIAIYRHRLSDLSWLMKSIAEPIARRANEEDGVDGKFWQGRFRCQALLSEKAILGAMAYSDLNPIRAKAANTIATAKYTSIRKRNQAIEKNPQVAHAPLRPLLGCRSANMPLLTEGEYLELVDFTGRQLHPNKRGKIGEGEPAALKKLGISAEHWSKRVQGFGTGIGAKWWRFIGELPDLLGKATELDQRTVFGVGLLRAMLKR